MSCCGRPSIQTMDYRWPMFAEPQDQVAKVNRICLHCYTHWAGTEGEVKQYTRKEWDALIDAAFTEEVSE